LDRLTKDTGFSAEKEENQSVNRFDPPPIFFRIDRVETMDLKNSHVFRMLAGAVTISFSGVWVKIASVPPETSAFYRVFIGALLLFAWLKWKGRSSGKKSFRHFLLLFLCGFAFATDLVFYHRSIVHVGPGLGTILPNFQVLVLAAVGIAFLGEPVRLKFVLAVPLAFAGLFFVVGIEWDRLGPLYRTGVYYGLAAAVCYSAFLLMLRRLNTAEAGSSTAYILMATSFATASFLGIHMLFEKSSFIVPDAKSAIALAMLGLFSQIFGWLLITNSLPRLQASQAGLLLLLQPALAFLWDVLFFSRPTSLSNWLGVALALFSIYLGSTATGGRR
jgi:drug/metabolite transporter (DMT)-like permease